VNHVTYHIGVSGGNMCNQPAAGGGYPIELQINGNTESEPDRPRACLQGKNTQT